MLILWSKFWALGGLNQKSKNMFCTGGHGELTAKKMARFHRERIKKNNLNFFVTDRQTDRVNC